MKRLLILVAALFLALPVLVWAVPTSVDRISNRIEPLIKSDSVRALFFTASSTSATSTFPVASSTTFCLGTDCRTSWPAGGSGTVYLASSSPSFATGQLTYVTGAGTVAGTSSPVVGSITATSTATSTFAGPVTVQGNLLQYKTYITVGAFNADFVTDGTSDQTQINAAIVQSRLASSSGVCLQDGNYYADDNINLRSNTTLTSCSGNASSVKIFFSGAATKGIFVNNATSSKIENVTLDGASQSVFNKLVDIVNSSDIVVNEIRGENATGFGVFIEAEPNATSSRVYVTNSYLEGLGNNDVIGGGAQNASGTVRDLYITNNYVIQNKGGAGSYFTAFAVVACTGCKVLNNIFEGNAVFSFEVSPHEYSEFNNNYIKPAPARIWSLIDIDSATTTIESDNGLNIVNNIIESGSITISGVSGYPTKYINIQGNIIRRCATGLNCLRLNYADTVNVNNNTFQGISQGATGSGYSAIYSSSSVNLNITNNMLFNNDVVFTDTSGATSVQFANNFIQGYNTFASGTVRAIIINNRGYDFSGMPGWLSVGTTTLPTTALFVNGTTTTSNLAVNLGTNRIAILNDGASISAVWGINNGLIGKGGTSYWASHGTSPHVWTTGATRNTMTEGTERMRLTTDGFLGIGTTTPSSLLTVAGDMRLTGRFADSASSTGAVGSVLTATANGTQWVATSSLGLGGGSGAVYLASTSPWTVGSLARIASNGTLESIATSSLGLRYTTLADTQSSFTANRIIHTNSAGTALTDTAGFVFTGTNLGIGTSTPLVPLHISSATPTIMVANSSINQDNSGQIYFSEGNFEKGDASSRGYSLIHDGNTNLLHVQGVTGATISNLATFDRANSRVGIGTSTPASLLTVSTPSSGTQTLFNRTSGNTGAFAVDFSNGLTNLNTQNALTFGTGLTNAGAGTIVERMRLTTTGNLGLATTSPSALLTVSGDMRLTGRLADSSSSTGAVGSVLTATADGTAWVATSSLGISGGGGFSDPLTTNGDIIARVSGATTRLPQGGNGTFLGVSGGVLGYYTPAGSGTINSGLTGQLAAYNADGTTLSGTSSIFVNPANGFVGINTTSATQRLEVAGNLFVNAAGTGLSILSRGATTNFAGQQFATAGTPYWTLGTRNDSTENIHLFNDTLGSTALFVNSATNNIGISTTTPSARFSVVGQALLPITEYFDSASRLVFSVVSGLVNIFGDAFVSGDLLVGTTTYNGATTTDKMVVDGYINQGEYIAEFCTSPAGETTAISADTLRGCGRYAFILDSAGRLNFVTPTTGTTSYYRLTPGTGTAVAAGDGMGLGWGSGIDFGDIQKSAPAMEWAMRQSVLTAATSTQIIGGLTSAVGLATDFGNAEPTQGFYVFASSTANYLFACNPSTGGTSYIDTGIASSSTLTVDDNPFVLFRLEVSGTSNTAVTAILKAATSAGELTQRAACTLNLSASTQVVAPTVAIGKGAATTVAGPDLHVPWVKFWYRTPLF